MEQNTLLHSSQLSIAVINITLYYNDYGPAYTDTVGWLSVATNTMTHRLRTSCIILCSLSWYHDVYSALYSVLCHGTIMYTLHYTLLSVMAPKCILCIILCTLTSFYNHLCFKRGNCGYSNRTFTF